MHAKRIGSVVCIAICLVAAAMTVSGCGGDTQATKLEAPEGIDWEAIESGGAKMDEQQALGE